MPDRRGRGRAFRTAVGVARTAEWRAGKDLGRYLFNMKASGPGQGLRPFRDPDGAADSEEDGRVRRTRREAESP